MNFSMSPMLAAPSWACAWWPSGTALRISLRICRSVWMRRRSVRLRCRARWEVARARSIEACMRSRSSGVARILRGRFEDRATAQAPGCLHEFGNESFFDGSVGREVSVPGAAEFPISLVFVGADECGCREEAESSRVAGRALFTGGRDRAGGELRVRAIRQELDFRSHMFMSGSRLAWRVKPFVDIHS